MNLIQKLQRNSLINTLVKTLRVNRLMDAYLKRFPITRETPFGLTYKVESVPSLVVANEAFSTDDYAKPISQIRPKTFVDLGSNVGYFPVLVAEIMKSRAIKGICVEPNPQLHPSIDFHLSKNELSDVHLIKGLVLNGASGTEADFFVNPSHIASSVTGIFNPLVAVGGEVRKIRVPVVDIAREWHNLFGSQRIEILKVDIEGAEVEFLKSHTSFLELVDAILIEWHVWITTLDEVSGVLKSASFSLEKVCHQDEHVGTAFFSRKAWPFDGALPGSRAM
jgi:FkbM family methyltransferase